MNKANECTCPSGDGSLVHPCPAHPAVEQADASSCQGTNCGTTTGDHSSECLAEAAAGQGWELKPGDLCGRDCPIHKISVEQAGGDERAAFEAWWQSAEVLKCKRDVAMEAWQARAALAQPSQAPTEGFTHFPELLESVQQMDAMLKANSAQAEAERPEVVARVVHSNPVVLEQCAPLNANDEMMTFAQHAASVARWAEMFNRVEQQRDVAQARVAELERGKVYVEARRCDECQHDGINDSATGVAACHECDWTGPEPEEDKCPGCQRENCMAAACPQCGARYVLVASEEIAAPVAQAQQLHDLDKQCRDDVARALGLRPNQERGFAWSYLLASIKSCVKASGDSAQAQHSVPEEFSFEYRHPNGESHTVTVSRDQVINEMPDFLFEALCSKFCNCEPAGETNVVECCCDEYAEEFKLLAAAPGNSAQHSVPEGWKLVPLEAPVEMLRAGSIALGMEPLSDGSDGGYPITGQQSTIRQCYAAMLAAAPGKEGV